ncbi:MAG: 4Fe-4S binding protein, partial [Bacilli bacterium]|nr:4Fe-4S binding protein [Bacilli bacterium]
MACEDKCPTKAIYQTIGNDGHKYIKINEDKCIECKLCEKTCPAVNNLTYGDNSIHTNKFYAGWAKNNKLRGNAATSGIFGAIAKYFLDQGGWIAGAIMDGIDCKYIVTNSIDDIARLQGSKYTYSNPKGIFGQILALLKSGNIVLFSGLPCHVAALISFIPSSLQTHLYT